MHFNSCGFDFHNQSISKRINKMGDKEFHHPIPVQSHKERKPYTEPLQYGKSFVLVSSMVGF